MGRRLIRAKVVLIVSIAICLSTTTVGLAAEDVSLIAKKILPATVFIYDANGKLLEQGSGFFVSKEGDIITCYHVLKGYQSVTVTTSDKKVYRVKNITAINKTNDLIKLSLSTTDHGFNSLKLNTTTSEVGQEIIVVGGPYGFENTVSEGIVSAIRENKTQITAPVSPGSSGGPVVNMNGEVIGVVSNQILVGQNLNFAIPAYLISTLKPASSEQGKEITQPVTQGTHIFQIGPYNVSVNLSVPADYTVQTPAYQSKIDAWWYRLSITPTTGGKIAIEIEENSKPLSTSSIFHDWPATQYQNMKDRGVGGYKYSIVSYKGHDAVEDYHPAQDLFQGGKIVDSVPERHSLLYLIDKLTVVIVEADNAGEALYREILDPMSITKNSSDNI
jgi:hypothetical protein